MLVFALISSPFSFYYLARAYQLKGAKYRQEQIKYCNLAIKSNFEFNEHGYIYILTMIAKAYEGECLFDEAIQTNKQLLSKYGNYTPAHIHIAHIMVKQHKLNEAIAYLENVLQEIKNHPYYYTDLLTGETKLHYQYESDIRCLPIDIQELKDKKAKGYVYKPKKKK